MPQSPAGSSHAHKALPLIIGFTGHRAFRDEDSETISARLREIFTSLLVAYPSTPLLLMTSIAEGADRIVVRVAIEMGIDFIVPLPMPPEIYETDFEGAHSKEEFRDILKKAQRWFTLPLVEGTTADSIREPGYDRNPQYAQVGAFLARYSQIMIAVWDGIVVERLGGTSMVVSYKLQGIPALFGPPQSPLDPVETGPVYHIVARRKDNPDVIGEPLTIKKYFPRGYPSDEEAELAFAKIYEQIDSFNRDIIHYEKHISERKKQSAEYLFPSEHEQSLTEAQRTTRDYYTSADVLASYFQRYTYRTFIGIFTSVFLAAFFFDIYAHVFDNTVVLSAYLGSLVLAFIWYRIAKQKQYQTKYLDYRSLAEGLRVQFFWQYAGINDSAGDYYLRKQKSELDWIRYALRTIAIPSDVELLNAEQHTPESRYDRFTLVLKHWVDDQTKYYPRAMKRDHKKLFKLELLINFFFTLGIALAALQLTAEPQHFLVVAIGLAPLVAALLGGYIERNALVGHIKQYERMGELFQHARNWLSKLLTEGKRHEAIDCILELGKEALSENGDWMLLHRERPLEVPKG
ncbi:MAG: hypothetical protein Q8896_05590 [Bacteroidota bacterium]|nr:hypothetical protein [Bacteroidota bacterium]